MVPITLAHAPPRRCQYMILQRRKGMRADRTAMVQRGTQGAGRFEEGDAFTRGRWQAVCVVQPMARQHEDTGFSHAA